MGDPKYYSRVQREADPIRVAAIYLQGAVSSQSSGSDSVSDVVFSYTVSPDEIVVRGKHPRLGNVGFVNASPLDIDPPVKWEDVPNRMFQGPWEDFDSLRFTVGKRSMGCFGVRSTSTHHIFRGEGLGTRLYLILAKLASDQGCCLAANDTYEGGGTTLSALRVWGLLKRYIPTVNNVTWGGGLDLKKLLEPLPSRRGHGFQKRSSMTNSGDEIELSGPKSIPAGSQGWVLYRIEAKVRDKPVGFIKVSWIPGSTFKERYPTILHYLIEIQGRGLGGSLGTKEDRRRFMLDVLDMSESTPLTDRKLTSMMDAKYGDSYRSFQDYHVDKPQVDYVAVNMRREGIGTTLYLGAAKWLGGQGYSLWSSGTQTTEAKQLWQGLQGKGYQVGSNGGRLFLTVG